MANNPSTEKRIRQAETNRERNRSLKGRMRTSVKTLRKAIEANDKDRAAELLPGTLSLIDSTAQKGVIHANAAARTKSRLTQAVAKL